MRMHCRLTWTGMLLAAMLTGLPTLQGHAAETPGRLDLSGAVIVVRPGERPSAEHMASTVLIEEVGKRTGLQWTETASWPEDTAPVIAITVAGATPELTRMAPVRSGEGLPEQKPEGFRLYVEKRDGAAPTVWLIGADARGALYAAAHFLRTMTWSEGSVSFPAEYDLCTAPAYPIRGHQLGYRHTANAYDAWDVATYDQHIRELVLFGANCVENIPSQDEPGPHAQLSRAEMNVAMSKICQRYGIDYWAWIPAEFDLNDTARRDHSLEELNDIFQSTPLLNAVFIPGGDPGDNPPDLLMPYAADMAARLIQHHPDAKIWISLQGFGPDRVDSFYAWLDAHQPDWLGGVVHGPSSPPIAETRRRLPKQYGLRHYPDITHSLVCQYPVYWWDQAFALTLGREGPNPQPAWYTHVHNWYAPWTDGFLSYSDGINDDVNKAVWSRVSWDPSIEPRQTCIEYANFFFGSAVAERAADGILALEKNWEGVLVDNGAVDATLMQWQALEAVLPRLGNNWRWQLCLLRAYYDAYTRHRLLYETQLEADVNALLAKAPALGAAAAMEQAEAILKLAETGPVKKEWRQRIEELCVALFDSIGYQTSVPRFQAKNGERGAILDYVDRPLNNRWWLEDEFKKIREFATEEEKLARLEVIRTWESPGLGSYYDDIGNVAQMEHVALPAGPWVEPDLVEMRNPHFPWTENGFSRARLSWLCLMRWPEKLTYRGLNPEAEYFLRATGRGGLRPIVDGVALVPSAYPREQGAFKEFPIPPELYADGEIAVTFGDIDEYHLNWRLWSYLAEIWLIKK
ncbi:MAG TPA: hypothetical protein PLD73_08815 [Candidatus Hydrogenedentes bacterium]|nr:hypothetical protein [Candidatus Hydrogenedentota bacterium]HPJ98819.1 hypothetical protein [Candidatus Hydrogenedentota bacterium]